VAMTATQLAAASGVGFEPWAAPGVTPASSSGNVLAAAAWGMPFGAEPGGGGNVDPTVPAITCGTLPTAGVGGAHVLVGGGGGLS
jgi:hypothetical protein